MAWFKSKSSAKEHREKLRQLEKQRAEAERKRRGGNRSESLVGLRLGTVLKQLQAVQAIQGLQELLPRDRQAKGRFTFSDDRQERAAQRQWLMFKADWLEALLEDALDEIEALDEHERQIAAKEQTDVQGDAPAD